MADTIDRIQVEFTANIQEFVSQLSGIEAGISRVNESCSSVESAASSYASAMQDTGTSTASAVSQISEYTKASAAQAEAARTAAAETKIQGERTAEAFDLISSSFTFLKNMLATFGVSVGVGALISQVKELAKEAEKAGKAYGQMYNAIYYTTGELTQAQQDLAKTLRLEGFETADVAETIGRLTSLFPDAERTIAESGTTVLAELSEELLWMNRKGYGELSELIDLSNAAFKKWNIPSSEITSELGYLAAAYRDTNTDVSTLLTSLTNLDEVGKTLGYTFRDMADFISAANVAGNIGDLSNVGMRFESQFTARVSDMYAALLEGNAATLESAGIPAETAQAAVQTVIDEMAVDETAARVKAQELANRIVSSIFQAANEEAAHAATQAQASQIWADALGIEVSRVTNRLADLSMSATHESAAVRTANRDLAREQGLTTTQLVKVEKGLGTSDYRAQNTAKWEEELSTTWFAKQSPLIEKRVNEYQKAGYEAMLSSYLGRTGPYSEVMEQVTRGSQVLNPMVSAMEQTGLALYDWLITTFFPTSNDNATAIGTWLETCANQITAIGNMLSGTPAEPEPAPEPDTASETLFASWIDACTDQLSAIGTWLSGLAPVGTASAAEIIGYAPEYLKAAESKQPAEVYPEIAVNPEITVTPEVAVYPQVSVTPDISVHPAVSLMPEVSVQPDITVTPDVAVYPQVAVSPEVTVNPEVNLTPEIAVNPAVSVYPQVDVTPEVSINPEVNLTPEIAVNPEVSVYPQVDVTPDIAVNPEVSVYPQVDVSPEVTVNPEVNLTPEITVTPDVSVYPQVTVSPEVSVTPEITLNPEISVNPELTINPDIDIYPSITVTPEIQVTPTIQLTPDMPASPPVSVSPIISVTPEIAVYPEISVTAETAAFDNSSEPELRPEISVYPSLNVYPEITVPQPEITVPPIPQPELTVAPALTISPQITVENSTTQPQELSLPQLPDTASALPASPDITVSPQISVIPEIRTETVIDNPETTQQTVPPAISVSPEITVTPEIRNINTVTITPQTEPVILQTLPAITVTPFVSLPPAEPPAPRQGNDEPMSYLANISAFFEQLISTLKVPLTPEPAAEPQQMVCPGCRSSEELSKPADTNAADDTAAYLGSILAAGTAAFSEVIAYLNRILAELASLRESPREVTVNQHITAPVADTYAVKNAAARGVSVAQAGLWRQ